MFVFATVVSLLTLAAVLSPFFIGKGGQLAAAASVNSPERLEAIKRTILERYIEDEKAYEEKRLSRLAWEQRRLYLSNRYIDTARRLDFIRSLVTESQGKEGQS